MRFGPSPTVMWAICETSAAAADLDHDPVACQIRRWQPWAKSTGPRSPDGKARAARNVDKGGRWRETRELFKWLNQEMPATGGSGRD